MQIKIFYDCQSSKDTVRCLKIWKDPSSGWWVRKNRTKGLFGCHTGIFARLLQCHRLLGSVVGIGENKSVIPELAYRHSTALVDTLADQARHIVLRCF
jgi:hypothetical protein